MGRYAELIGYLLNVCINNILTDFIYIRIYVTKSNTLSEHNFKKFCMSNLSLQFRHALFAKSFCELSNAKSAEF